MGAISFIRIPNLRNVLSKKKTISGLCENAWFPWQSIMLFSRMGCTYKVNHMSAATEPRLLNLVPDSRLDTCLLFHGQISKLSNLHIHEY